MDISAFEIDPTENVVVAGVFETDEPALTMSEVEALNTELDEDIKAQIDEANAAVGVEVKVDENAESATKIHDLRTKLNLSRAIVQKHTGLTGSIVWRSEQSEGVKPVTAEQRTKIWDFLVAVDSDIEFRATVKPIKTPTPTATQALAADVSKYVDFINELDDAIKLAITERKAKKSSVKDLNGLLEMITKFNF